MARALELAAQGLGRVAPNPSVGCVIVKDGHVIAEARTGDGGRPHAETEALAMAGSEAEGSHVYVSLEPCAHTGKTPPCAKALVEASVEKVIVACKDPDERVNGQGIEMLRNAGIQVVENVMRREAEELNAGFFLTRLENRPWITLKTATSLDGKIATRTGHSKWITGTDAREAVHRLRDQHDAVLTGSGTVLADDPQMTVRIIMDRTEMPLRIILDRRRRVSKEARIHGNDGRCLILQEEYGDLSSLMSYLVQEHGITRLMVEAGATLTSSFIVEGIWDELFWFRAPVMIGDDGQSALKMAGIDVMQDAMRLQRLSITEIGHDLLEIYRKEP